MLVGAPPEHVRAQRGCSVTTAPRLSPVKSTVETVEENRVKLVVDVDEAEFEVEVDKAFRKVARDVRMPGFRQGKVPRKVLEARFGSAIARGQALEDSIPDFFVSAISEHEVDMITPPEYEIISGEEEGPLRFEAIVGVRPVIEVAGYQDMKVEIPAPEPTDDDIDGEIENFLGQFAELATVDRAAAADDTVTMDIATTHDGEEIEGLTANDYSYKVGTGAPVAELDENLTGASVGDELSFDAEHPDPEAEGALHFEITVKDVQERVLPELSDEIVADATEFESADDFKADIAKRVTEAKRSHANNQWREKAAAQLGELVDADVPESLVDIEVRDRIEDMAQRLSGSGIGFETYLQMMGQSIEDLVEQMRGPAEESVKVDLALRALAAAEGLEATEADVEEEFTQLAEGMSTDVADIKSRISTPNQLMLMRADISKRKAAEWLLDSVSVVDENGNPIDKDALEPEPHEDDHDHAGHEHGNEEE